MANKNKTYTLSFDVKNGDDVEKVQVELGKTARTVGELEHQIESLTDAIKKAEFGTPEFAKLTKELGNAKTKLVNFEESIADITNGEKVEGFVRIGSAIAGGFAIAEAASQAFGSQLGIDQAQLEKYQQRLQILLVTMEGLQLVQEALGKENKFLTQFFARNAVAANAQTVAVGKATIAQRALNFVMRINPLGLILTAITLVIGAFYLYSKASDSTKAKIKEFAKTVALLNPFGLLYKGLELLYKNFGPFKRFIDGTIQLVKDVYATVKDFIAQTTGLFDTEAEKQKKIRIKQIEFEVEQQKKLKELAQQRFEQESEIARRQAKLRNASASQQLAQEQKIADETLKRYKTEAELQRQSNEFIKKNLGIEVLGKEQLNELTLKELELELSVKDIRKQSLEQQKTDIEALLAKIIEKGEKEQIQAKLAGKDEVALARLKLSNLQEQEVFLKRFYAEDSLNILKIKEQVFDTQAEIREKTKQNIQAIERDRKAVIAKSDITRLDAAITQQQNEEKAKKEIEEAARKQRIEDTQKAVQDIIDVYATLGELITAQIDDRITQSQDRIAELDQQAADSVSRADDLIASLDEARGARRLDAIKQIEAERLKQKQLSEEKLAQEKKIQAEETKKQRLLATTNALNQTTAAINSVVATTEALKGTASQSKLLFPFNVVAIASTVASIIAAFSAIKSIKFASGGYTGSGYGTADETGYKPAGIVHEKEYVVPDPVLSTPKGARLVGELESMRKGFAQGGYTSDVVPNFSGVNSAIDASQSLMLQKLEELKISNIALANRKTVVSVEAIDKVQTEVNTIKVQATT